MNTPYYIYLYMICGCSLIAHITHTYCEAWHAFSAIKHDPIYVSHLMSLRVRALIYYYFARWPKTTISNSIFPLFCAHTDISMKWQQCHVPTTLEHNEINQNLMDFFFSFCLRYI